MDRTKPKTPVRGRCPICRAPTVFAYRPFCSRRCADVDLARWLGGAYAIPDAADADEDGDDAGACREGSAEGIKIAIDEE
jgi:endogenous inhibitor of DNA gyrase (YacG/DUF329 family)